MENVVAEYRSEDVWSSSSVDDVVLSSAVHPNLLFGYRLLAFLFALVVSLIHLKIKGIRPLKFYTKWNFYALTLYFGVTIWETIWFRRRKSRDREHPFGPGSYLAIILYHLNMTTVWAVDLGCWGVLYPLSMPYPELQATFFFNTFSYIEHALNAVIMMGSVGVWCGIYMMWIFMHYIHTGSWIYEVLNTAYSWSLIFYCVAFLAHQLAFHLFAFLHRVKTKFIAADRSFKLIKDE